MQVYSENSRLVTQIIEEAAPAYEKASIDEHYLDITGMDKYICDSFTWTKQLRQKIIKESGLPISFGLSTNKLVSKIATTEAKPNGELFIEPGKEKAFLAPMDVSKIPGVGEGDRHHTQFRCAAWLTEQGAPPALVSALLTEPGRDVGLTPKDVD